MAIKRQPDTMWEQRVDFEAIDRSTRARHARFLADARKILASMLVRTLSWVEQNLANRKLKTAVPKFKLPLQARYRALCRRYMENSARAGLADVAKEFDQPVPKLKVADLTRIRASADTLFEDHMTTLETALKREWSKAMHRNVSAAELEWVTRKVFADFAGWEQPDGPKR